ncbi:MAG TPA: hypothetical protein VM010_02380 [Chitinophagaceae bacterium]|nr:hypothetical protein [Chitinophagaceae bacterium]
MSTTNEPVIPEQNSGASSDTEATATFEAETQAKAFYEVVKQRLLHVNAWQKWAGAATAKFQLTDATGNDVDRTVNQGDHFKIDIPGPGPVTGDGFDWVQVQTIEETASGESEQIIIQVKPATNPTNANNDVAHFFSDDASSSFVVKREGNVVSAAVHGRNEKPNARAEKLVDKARNAAVATGAVAAFSKLQWKSLVNGLVKKEA